MSFPKEDMEKVFSDLASFLEFFVNLQSVKWALIGVAFALFKFKKDGRTGLFHFWYELAFIFFTIYIGAPIALLNGIQEQYLPILAAIIGYAGVNRIVNVSMKFINIWLDLITKKYLGTETKPKDKDNKKS